MIAIPALNDYNRFPMLGFLILLFITVPILELALLIKVGQSLGVLNTISIVFGTGIIGVFFRVVGAATRLP